MYLPTWLLLLGVAFLVSHIQSSKKKKSSEVIATPEKDSYKLEIFINPYWPSIYNMAIGGMSESQLHDELEKKERENPDEELNLYGRRYYFVEYYDFSSGQTIRFQKTSYQSGKSEWRSVDEFGDRGFFFGKDAWRGKTDDLGKDREKHDLIVGDSFIKNNATNRNILFNFPLKKMFNFLLDLGLTFHGSERNLVLKWPDEVEKDLKKMDIEYNTYSDASSEHFDIEEYAPDFLKRWTSPKISIHESGNKWGGFFKSKRHYTSFGVRIKLFRPGENEYVDLTNR
jgi:hypothetical protein